MARRTVFGDPALRPLAFDSGYKTAVTLEVECLSDGYELRGILQPITGVHGGSCRCIDLILVRDRLETAAS